MDEEEGDGRPWGHSLERRFTQQCGTQPCKEPGRFWKRKLVGWHEHLLRTTILTGRVIGVKRNGSVYTFASGRE